MGSWRKAYGALKDSTKVGLAKVNSDFKVSNGDGDARKGHDYTIVARRSKWGIECNFECLIIMAHRV
jgi:hypothetical protein